MGTLVQAPERASVEVAGLQASVQPVKGGGLGTFLTSILPAVDAEVGKYQKESRDRLVALGRNDKLNKVYRDVSLLDRQSYAQGRNYQNAINGQIALAKDYQERVNNIDPNNPDPDEMLRIAEQYNNATVDNIHLSNLPSDMKETLYEAQLKENAVYLKMVDKKIKQITEANVYQARINATAMLARDVDSGEYTPEELITRFEAYREKSDAGQLLANPDGTAEERDAVFQADIMSVLEYSLSTLKGSADPEAIDRIEYLAAAAEGTLGLSIKAGTEIRKKAMQYSAETYSAYSEAVKIDVDDFITQAELDPNSVTGEDFEAKRDELMNLSKLPPEVLTQQISKLNSAWVSRHKALMSGQVLYDATQMSASDIESMGKSTGQLVTEALEAYQKEDGGRTGLAGFQMIKQFGLGAEYLQEGVKKGSEVATRTFLPAVIMDDNAVKNDEYAKMREERFGMFANLYRNAVQGNGAMASDIISGIPEEYREAFITTINEGGSLEDVRRRVKSPTALAADYSNIDKANNALTPKLLGLDKKMFGQTGGARTRSMSQYAHQNYMDKVNVAVTESRADLVRRTRSSNPEELAAIMNQVFVQSENGYSATIANTRVSKMLDKLTADGTTPLNRRYMAKAIDAERQRLAKLHNVEARDIITAFNSTGDAVSFDLYDTTTGDLWGLRDGKPRLVDGSVGQDGVSTARLLANARTLYKADSTRQRNPSPSQKAKQQSATIIGRGALHDQATGRSSEVKLTAPYAAIVGNNPELGSMVAGHLADWYGFTSTPLNTEAGRAYGIGATGKMVDKSTAKKFEAASGNVQKTMEVQGEYFASRFRGLNMSQAFDRVGVPKPREGMYPKEHKAALTLMYSAGYLHGNAGLYGDGKGGHKGVINAMQAPTYKEAEAIFKKSLLFDKTGGQSKRNSMYLSALKEHFKTKGKLR